VNRLTYKGTVRGYMRYARPVLLRAAMRGWSLANNEHVLRLQRDLIRAGQAEMGETRFTRERPGSTWLSRSKPGRR